MQVVGLNTNLKFLKDLATHPSFVSADVHTDFIEVSIHFPWEIHLYSYQGQFSFALFVTDLIEVKKHLDRNFRKAGVIVMCKDRRR